MTAGALYGARRTLRQSLGIAFGSSRNLGGGVQSVAAAESMASPRENGQRREIACFAVQCVSLPLFDSSQLSVKSENKASHTKSLLKHRRQPDALNDSGGAIRRSPNPAPKSRYCFCGRNVILALPAILLFSYSRLPLPQRQSLILSRILRSAPAVCMEYGIRCSERQAESCLSPAANFP